MAASSAPYNSAIASFIVILSLDTSPLNDFIFLPCRYKESTSSSLYDIFLLKGLSSPSGTHEHLFSFCKATRRKRLHLLQTVRQIHYYQNARSIRLLRGYCSRNKMCTSYLYSFSLLVRGGVAPLSGLSHQTKTYGYSKHTIFLALPLRLFLTWFSSMRFISIFSFIVL